jgi:hypothetical protein
MAFTPAEISRRFTHRPPKNERIAAQHREVRSTMKLAADVILLALPDGREASLCATAMEEALFWANAAIARQEGNNPDE